MNAKLQQIVRSKKVVRKSRLLSVDYSLEMF